MLICDARGIFHFSSTFFFFYKFLIYWLRLFLLISRNSVLGAINELFGIIQISFSYQNSTIILRSENIDSIFHNFLVPHLLKPTIIILISGHFY